MLLSFLPSQKKVGYSGCTPLRPEPPPVPIPKPPCSVSVLKPPPPERPLLLSRPPPPPGESLGLVPAVHPLRPHPEPPLHTVSVTSQFFVANTGVAALKLVVVAAAIIAAVVIAIARSLVVDILPHKVDSSLTIFLRSYSGGIG